MLKLTKNQKVKSLDIIRAENTNSKALVILNDIADIQNLQGYVYAISTDETSFESLCKMSTELRNNGTQNIIVGSYRKEGIVSVQYETR